MINVFVTIDVETSMGGAFSAPDELEPVDLERSVHGKIGNKEYGVPLIMDILEKSNFMGTFFVEPMCSSYFGENAIEEVCRTIAKRGHDVQLHLHPNYQIFQHNDWKERCRKKKMYSDILAHYKLEEQEELIRKGKAILKRCGVSPVAFRAGCFGANINTFEALRRNEIMIDSSYNAVALQRLGLVLSDSPLNDISNFGSVIELPITNYYPFKVGKSCRSRTLDIGAVGFREFRNICYDATEAGIKNIVLLLHSFSFITRKDIQFNTICPNKILIKRFNKICEFIKENHARFRAKTFQELYNSVEKDKKFRDKIEIGVPHKIPYSGFLSAIPRYISSAIQYI